MMQSKYILRSGERAAMQREPPKANAWENFEQDSEQSMFDELQNNDYSNKDISKRSQVRQASMGMRDSEANRQPQPQPQPQQQNAYQNSQKQASILAPQQSQQYVSTSHNSNNVNYVPPSTYASKAVREDEIEFDLRPAYTFQDDSLNSNSGVLELVRFDVSQALFLFNERFGEFLQARRGKGKVAFAAVWGAVNSGKSHLVESLATMQDQQILPRPTQGLWLHLQPIGSQREDIETYIIEIQGWSMQNRENIAFLLIGLLLSNIFLIICNTQNFAQPQEENLKLFSGLPHVAQSVLFGEAEKPTSQKQVSPTDEQLAYAMPYCLMLISTPNNQIEASSVEFEKFLRRGGSGENQSSQLIRNALNTIMRKRECFPLNNNNQYTENVRKLNAFIAERSQCRQLNGVALNARSSVYYLESLVTSLNQGQSNKVNLTRTQEFVAQRECAYAYQYATSSYEKKLLALLNNRTEPLKFAELYAHLRNVRDDALDSFHAVAGIKKKNPFYLQFRDKLQKQIDEHEEKVFDKNNELSIDYNQKVVELHSQELKLKIANKQYKAESRSVFLIDLDRFLDSYDNAAIGQQKADVLTRFLTQEHESMIDCLVSSIDEKYDIENSKQGGASAMHQRHAKNESQQLEAQQQQQIQDLERRIQIFENRIHQLEDQKKKLEAERKNAQKEKDEAKSRREQSQAEVMRQQAEKNNKSQRIMDLQAEIKALEIQVKKNSKKCCC